MRELYRHRKLAEAYPDLDRSALETYTAMLATRPDDTPTWERRLILLDRLVDLSGRRRMLVLGCGPRPTVMKVLLENNYDVVGVEPVPAFVQSARAYLRRPDRVLDGAAEAIPLPDRSQQLVFCDSVLEHVTSPTRSLDEMYRVLTAGGIAFITTTNRHRISPRGNNEEYRVPYLNWLPDIVKECFAFHHLHYDPRLANYSMRPAVHWFSYAELCGLGRRSGFARFYSTLDLCQPEDPSIRRSWTKRRLLEGVKFNPWLRALALTQLGDTIIMLKA